jgi:hypothetical protein
MNKPIPILTAFLVAVGSLAAAAGGCELIASVDRNMIPGTGGSGGGTGGSTTTTTTTTTTTGTGGTCPGGAMACQTPADCPSAVNDCVAATCPGGCCGTTNQPSGMACTSNNGKVCDGNGNCVACVMASDCAAQASLCKVNTCASNTCGTMNAPADTTCSDNGGVVCDGSGTCASMHCADNVKDADETDIDCGGASCSPCANTKGCMVATDCASGFCSGTTCTACAMDADCASGKWCDLSNNGGTCTKTANQGGACSAGDQCASGHCVDGVCCDTACNGTCQACTMALTGQADGTCANETAGKPAPAGQCSANGACGNTGNCAAGGVCEQTAMGVPCGAPSCNNGQLTPAGSCNGSGTCTPGSAMACAGGFICASMTACKTACAADTDCESASSYCANPGASGTCVPKGGDGAACSANDQCSSGLCGTNGGTHCCKAGTTCPATVAACGTTDCTNTGVCNYPDSTVAPASLQTPHDCQKVVCNGSGGDTVVTDTSDTPVSTTLCLINGVCNGNVPQFDPAPTGTDCTGDNNPPNHVCGNTGNGNIAGACVQCNDDGDCLAIQDAGSLVCDTSQGKCLSCVSNGGTVGSAGECASDCCSHACSSGVTCM